MQVDKPTRHEQSIALLRGGAAEMARRILGRRPLGADDYQEAFTAERIDLVSAIPDPETLLELTMNRPGPTNGLYVMAGDSGYRLYHQERGEVIDERRNLSFDEARTEAVDRLLMLSGVPYTPAG